MHEQSCFLFFFDDDIEANDNINPSKLFFSPTVYVLFYYNSQDTGHFFSSQTGEKQKDVLGGSHKVS
jgi:hypothetical protein